jgi:hypothetical protein
LLREAVAKTKEHWASSLRDLEQPSLLDDEKDLAFYGKYSLLGTDQGIRGFLAVFNDLSVEASEELSLGDWTDEAVFGKKKTGSAAATDDDAVSIALASLHKQDFGKFLEKVASGLSKFDWRTSSTPGLSDAVRLRQGVFRGSSGYKELRIQLLKQLSEAGGKIGTVSDAVLKIVK